MKPLDLLKTSKVLLASAKGKPTDASLRRATSSAYYALFHCLARNCADLLIGGTSADRSNEAWKQVYRALDHNFAKDRCKDKAMIKKFPRKIEDFANTFVTLQEKRHQADYDPGGNFLKSGVTYDIDLAEQAVKDFSSVGAKHRRAFCAYVLFKRRV